MREMLQERANRRAFLQTVAATATGAALSRVGPEAGDVRAMNGLAPAWRASQVAWLAWLASWAIPARWSSPTEQRFTSWADLGLSVAESRRRRPAVWSPGWAFADLVLWNTVPVAAWAGSSHNMKGTISSRRDVPLRATADITVQRLRGNNTVRMGSGDNIAVQHGPDGKLLVDAGISDSRAKLVRALEGGRFIAAHGE
jgi:hypothetical protein